MFLFWTALWSVRVCWTNGPLEHVFRVLSTSDISVWGQLSDAAVRTLFQKNLVFTCLPRAALTIRQPTAVLISVYYITSSPCTPVFWHFIMPSCTNCQKCPIARVLALAIAQTPNWRTIYNPRMLHFLIRLLNYYWFLLRCSMRLSLFAAKLHSVWSCLSTQSFRAVPRVERSLTGRQQKLGVINACRSCPGPTLLMFPPNCLAH